MKAYPGSFEVLCHHFLKLPPTPACSSLYITFLLGIGTNTSAMVSLSMTFMRVGYSFVSETVGNLTCGAMAGTLSKMILYPLDLVRHRLQVC